MDSTALDPPVDIAELVRTVRAGRVEAFADLVRLHQAAVRAYLNRLLRDAHAADDLAQEVFLEAYQNLAAYSGAGSFASWLFGIARHQAASYLRRFVRRKQLFSSHVERLFAERRDAELRATPTDAEHESRRLDTLAGCLDELAPTSRRLVDACYFQGRSAESLATELRRNAGAVRTTLWRIRQTLGECLRRKLGAEEEGP